MKGLPSIQDPARPRVLHFITRLGLGGAESVALALVRWLRAEVDFGVYAVRGVENSDIGRAMQRELNSFGVPLYCGAKVPIKLGGMILAGLGAGGAVRRFRPTHVHLHTEIPESAYAAMIAIGRAGRGPALVRTIHNSVYWHFWPRLGRWCERRMRDSWVAGVSEDARVAFNRHRAGANVGTLPADARVIFNGVEAPTVAVRSPHAPPRVLFAGRFEPEKGADLIPEIIQRTSPPPGGANLTLLGRGVFQPELEALARNAPPGWAIEVVPPRAHLAQHLADYDLVLVPSRFEGLCLLAIEAVLAGVPVIACDAPGLREALPTDYAGKVPVNDADAFAQAVTRALRSPLELAPAVAAARAFAEQKFSPHAMAAGYRQLYADASRANTR